MTPHAAKHVKPATTMFRIMVQSNKIHHEFLLRRFRRMPIGIGPDMLLDWIGIGFAMKHVDPGSR
jgi:hypothetical protein